MILVKFIVVNLLKLLRIT